MPGADVANNGTVQNLDTADAAEGRNKKYVILAQNTEDSGAVDLRGVVDSACEGTTDLFLCDSRWSGGAIGTFPNGTGNMTVAQFLATLSRADGVEGVEWSVIGDQRFDSRTAGVRTTNVADASSTSTFALEMEFDPFGSQRACTVPCEKTPCALEQNVIKVQHDAPRHVLELIDYAQSTSIFDRTYRFKAMGSGVDVYVVDGNVQANDEFNDIVGGTTRLSTDLFRSTAAEQNSEFACSADHGTHVASLVAGISYGVAKNATIIPVSVQPGCSMSGRVSDLAAGLSWISDRISNTSPSRPAVVSMSLQLPRSDPASMVIDSLVADLVARGAIIVAAAGNYRADACDFSPAGIPNVLTVGALDSLQPWSNSNFGPCVDIWAQGVSIVGASPTCFKCTSAFTGTSQSAPIVSGLVAARLESRPSETIDEVRKWLLENAVTLDNMPGNTTYKSARAQRDWSYF